MGTFAFPARQAKAGQTNAGQTNVGDPERINLVSDGVVPVPSDESPATAAFNASLIPGAAYYLPKGRYFIEPQGPNAGGINVSLTDDIDLLMDAGAEFFTAAPGLDNDFFTFVVPTNGVGLPSNRKPRLRIKGGRFDATEQKNSTSIPFAGTWPPVNLGTSGTCDCIGIYGQYQAGGTGPFLNGIGSAIVEDCSFYAGAHWEIAGGDQSIVIGPGTDISVVQNCRLQGARDLGIYATTGQEAGGPVHIQYNEFINCFFAVAFKRAIIGSLIGNRCVNSIVAWTIGGSDGASGGFMAGNEEENCHISLRLDYVQNLIAIMGTARRIGCTDSDGVQVAAPYSPNLIWLRGAQGCHVSDLSVDGKNPACTGDWKLFSLEKYTHPTLGDIPSTKNWLTNLHGVSGVYSAGAEVAGEADYNFMQGCRAEPPDAGVPNVGTNGANSMEERFDPAGGRSIQVGGLGYNDGPSTTLPPIYRAGQRGIGINFGTNKAFVSINGVERVGGNTKAAYATLSTFADNAAALAGGLAIKDIYKTATGEVRIVV